MLGRRRRRRANIEPNLGQFLVFAGICYGRIRDWIRTHDSIA